MRGQANLDSLPTTSDIHPHKGKEINDFGGLRRGGVLWGVPPSR